jgi:hypothetical protein
LAALCLVLAITGCRGEPLAPAAERAHFRLNGALYVSDATAQVRTAVAAPDTLTLSLMRMDIWVGIGVEYSGVGTYILGPTNVSVWTLTGGDVLTGRYGGSATIAGQLVISEAGGVDEPLRAEFFFVLDHASGWALHGSTAAIRSGALRATLTTGPSLPSLR